MRIIGLIGPKGSGKDTTYDMLKEAKRVDGKISFAGPLKAICMEVFGLHFNLVNDAQLKELPLKEPITLTRKHIKTILNLMEDYVNPVTPEGIILYNVNKVATTGLEGRQFKTPRELLQIIGTDLMRERVYKRWHLEAAFSSKVLNATKEDANGDLRRVYKKDGLYAVTDVRFENEHEYLANKFGTGYKGFYVARPEADEVLATATHPSELETQKIRAKLTDSVIDNSGSLKDLRKLLETLDLDSIQASTSETETEGPTVMSGRFKFGRE